jgi:phosphatidyl-myo-inositol alpha-mannosyltransferase
MKIALVSPYDYSHPGGVVNHIRALDIEFTRRGHDVRMIAPASEPVNDADGRFIRIGTPVPVPVSGSIGRISLSVHLAPRIKETLEKEKFDIIHLHEPFCPMLCSAMLRFSHSVNVGTFHAAKGRPGYDWGKPITTYLLKRRNRKLHGRIAVSEVAEAFASRHVAGDYTIIPNGVSLERFNPDVLPLNKYQDGKLNILFVGRIEARKGLKYLIRAYARLKGNNPQIRLLIVGPGIRLRHKYEAMIAEKGIKDIVFVGPVTNEELPHYYATADIFCAPAIGRESFGMILLEAMASGRAVVASNIEGYNSVITNGIEGLLVPPRDDIAIAQALQNLVSDATLRKKLGARGMVTACRYDWSIVASQVLDYYEKVLTQNRSKQALFVASSMVETRQL